MLEKIFLQVINMSYIASIVIVFILVARLLLAKAPKKYSYILWAVALVRFIVPISFESVLSLIPVNPTPVSNDILYDVSPNINTGMPNIDQSISGLLPEADVVTSVNPMQIWIFIGSLIWILGIAILLVYGIVSFIRMKGNLKNANCVMDNIYQSDNVTTPFVLGLFQAKIYLPTSLSDAEKDYIVLHEQTHIRRFDHVIRFISYLALCIHWFNPLVWIAFWLSGKDMEMSCDESVINQLGYSVKKDYSQSLLNLATGRTKFGLTPLAFGEGDTKKRIKNIINFKKPKFYVLIITLAILIFMSIGLLSNPKNEEPDLSFLSPDNMLTQISEQEQVNVESFEYGNTYVSGVELVKWLDTAENDWKIKNISSPYELSPDIIIHVNDDTGNEIRFYESEPTLAMTLYQDEFRYYKIPEEDYLAVAAMAESAYPRVQSIKFTEYENGGDEATVTITDSNTIIRMAVLTQRGERYSPSLLFDSTQNDVPPVSEYIRIEMIGDGIYHKYFLYAENENDYYIDRPYEHINKIDLNIVEEIITIFTAPVSENDMKEQMSFDVEGNLAVIMSSPKTSSNPQDYIDVHGKEYEEIIKYGGEEALQYMLSQFEIENAEGLRGHIMMLLCKELLGVRNNVSDESLSPQQWYDALEIRQKIKLPNFEYEGQDPIEKLVYAIEIEKATDNMNGGFTVVAPKIFGNYEEGNLLKVFTTTFYARYLLLDNVLSMDSAGIVPVAITYEKDENGSYTLLEYEQARDGSEFGPSIIEYCTMPISGKEIEGLADKIFKHYGDHEDIRILMRENLYKHLKKNGITDAVLTNSQGEVEFTMSDPKYKP
ncbi:MAG: M56 family metallopeptidase [Eubacteriales bacterium]